MVLRTWSFLGPIHLVLKCINNQWFLEFSFILAIGFQFLTNLVRKKRKLPKTGQHCHTVTRLYMLLIALNATVYYTATF